jgi:hypothetical protein
MLSIVQPTHLRGEKNLDNKYNKCQLTLASDSMKRARVDIKEGEKDTAPNYKMVKHIFEISFLKSFCQPIKKCKRSGSATMQVVFGL